MDLEQYGRVVWRFKILVSVGVLAAFALAVLSMARISFDHGVQLRYRTPPSYKSQTTLLITQPGFPWGRTVSTYIPGDQKTGQPAVPASDPVRLATLTGLYAQLATSDQVLARLRPSERREGNVTVTAVPAPAYTSSGVLPLLKLEATAVSPGGASALANRATASFRGWLREEQDRGGIAPIDRVEVDVVTGASKAVVAANPKKTTAVVVFLTIVAAVFGLAMVLDNLRPATTQPLPEIDSGTAAFGPPHIAA
jgi:hypothetical protein